MFRGRLKTKLSLQSFGLSLPHYHVCSNHVCVIFLFMHTLQCLVQFQLDSHIPIKATRFYNPQFTFSNVFIDTVSKQSGKARRKKNLPKLLELCKESNQLIDLISPFSASCHHRDTDEEIFQSQVHLCDTLERHKKPGKTLCSWCPEVQQTQALSKWQRKQILGT